MVATYEHYICPVCGHNEPAKQYHFSLQDYTGEPIPANRMLERKTLRLKINSLDFVIKSLLLIYNSN